MGQYCSVCSKYFDSGLRTTDGRMFCSEECYETILPRCSVCQKPMRQWTELKNGQKVCSDKCYETILPKCSVCKKPMRQWQESTDGKQYCSDRCRITDEVNQERMNKTENCGKYDDYRAVDIAEKLEKLGYTPLDVMVTGVTGAGKSTTLNTIFSRTVATVGDGVDPETMNIDSYSLNKWLRIWDTPGLGDGIEQDKIHQREMKRLLNKTFQRDNKQYGFIDLVIVIIEGSNRDMGTTYKLISNVINNIPSNRIIVAVNQADMAMKGRHWNENESQPDDTLKAFLEEQAESIQRRIKEATGKNIRMPVYYSAKKQYNIEAFIDSIIDSIPKMKRTITMGRAFRNLRDELPYSRL